MNRTGNEIMQHAKLTFSKIILIHISALYEIWFTIHEEWTISCLSNGQSQSNNEHIYVRVQSSKAWKRSGGTMQFIRSQFREFRKLVNEVFTPKKSTDFPNMVIFWLSIA